VRCSEHQIQRCPWTLVLSERSSGYHSSGTLSHSIHRVGRKLIVQQEMSNPLVRPHLSFMPEDAGNELFEARHAARWLHELDEDLLTPMVRTGTSKESAQDFYTLEPALRSNGRVCMPFRWYRRLGSNDVWAKAWDMQRDSTGESWLVCSDIVRDVPLRNLRQSMPLFSVSFRHHDLPSPRSIAGKYFRDVFIHAANQ
jgi:hypothetical protein